MARRTFWLVALLTGCAGVLWAQMAQRPLNPRTGFSAGVGYGTANPTSPHAGEIFVLTAGAGDGGPLINIWDNANTEWDELESMDDFFASLSLTADVLPKADATAYLEDSRLFDDGTHISIGQASSNDSVVKLGDCGDDGGFSTDANRFLACLDGETNFEVRDATNNVGGFLQADSAGFTVGSYTANTFFFEVAATTAGFFLTTPAAGAGGTLATFERQLNPMDGNDEIVFFFLEVKNANHTGAANSNTLIGLDIGLNSTDTETVEAAIRVDTDYDITILSTDGSPTLPAMGFLGDTNNDTGINRPAEDEFQISTGGTAGVTVNANQMLRFDNGTALASLGTPAAGTVAYCTDCDAGTTPCAAVIGNGALATYNGTNWNC